MSSIKTDEADAPPLFPIDFKLAVAWMDKMKKVSKKPQSLGIVNEESRQISTQMEALVNKIPTLLIKMERLGTQQTFRP